MLYFFQQISVDTDKFALQIIERAVINWVLHRQVIKVYRAGNTPLLISKILKVDGQEKFQCRMS